MKLKKINAVLSLLTILALLVHIGYTVYCYLAFYYNPVLKIVTAVPFMVLACLHAVLGMAIVFLKADGTRLDLYPKQNRSTVIQRISAALIFPMLILHLNTYDLLKGSAEAGSWAYFTVLMISQPLFYGIVLAHIATSFSKALITLGWLSDREKQKKIDKAVCIICAVILAVSAFAVLKGQLAMFLQPGGME